MSENFRGHSRDRLRDTMHWLKLDGLRVSPADHVPMAFRPVLDAVGRNQSPEPVVEAVVRAYGFDSFMYGASTSFQPGQDSQIFTFTTLPIEWVIKYDREAYIEVDPRVQHWFESSLPLVWEQSAFRGSSQRLDQFLDDAGEYGVRSGVSFRIPDFQNWSVIACFNSSSPDNNDIRHAIIDRNLGDLLSFSYYFHEKVMRPMVARGLPPRSEGVALSSRERACLGFAAQGLTTEQIAQRIGVRPRTAQFHFDSIRTKLAVSNRQEAMVKAMQLGLLDYGA